MTDSTSFYDDPELQPPSLDDYNITFKQVGDSVRGRINRMERIKTQYGFVAKYWLFDLDRNMERTMLAGAIDLHSQLFKLRPEIGDVLIIELVAIDNRRYVFNVEVTADVTPEDEPF